MPRRKTRIRGIEKLPDSRVRIRARAVDPRSGKEREIDRVVMASMEEAIKLQAEWRDEIRRAAERQKEVPRLAGFAASWMRSKVGELKASTARTYAEILDVRVIPNHPDGLGDFFVDKITAQDIRDWRDRLTARLSASTVNGTVVMLKMVLGDASAEYGFPNPAARINRLRVKGYTDESPNVLSASELGHFLEVVRSRCPDYYALVLLLSLSGLRFGEATALRWSDLNGTAGLIKIERAQWRGLIDTPKTGKTRSVPLVPELDEVLRQHRADLLARQVPGVELGWMFLGRSGGMVTKGELRRSFPSRRRGGEHQAPVHRAWLAPHVQQLEQAGRGRDRDEVNHRPRYAGNDDALQPRRGRREAEGGRYDRLAGARPTEERKLTREPERDRHDISRDVPAPSGPWLPPAVWTARLRGSPKVDGHKAAPLRQTTGLRPHRGRHRIREVRHGTPGDQGQERPDDWRPGGLSAMGYRVLKVESHSHKVEEHLHRVADGTYRLPEFQRTFVWDHERILKLWDSLYHGFPIGQLMLWEPADIDFPMRSLGRSQAEVEVKKRDAAAVIDGQQRLTAIYLVLAGDTPLRFDLGKERFTYADGANALRLDVLRGAGGQPVPFSVASEEDFFRIHTTDAQRRDFGGAVNRLNGVLRNRALPSQTIQEADYATVLGVFKRLNQQGEPLNEAQLTMAGISHHWPGVFRRSYDLLRRMNTEMGFDEAEDPTFVFQVWTAVHTGQHLIKHLAPEDLERSRYRHLVSRPLYETSWDRTAAGISQLIELMKRELDLTNFRFIKAYYPLAVAAHFLATHPDATAKERDSLRRWLVLSLVSARYHEQAQSKYGADIKATTRQQDIRNLFQHRAALDPHAAESIFLTPERLMDASFRSAYTTLLYLVARRLGATDWYQTKVRVGEKVAEGPWEFHHIFPDESFAPERGVLRQQYEEAQADGDEKRMQAIEADCVALESRIASVGNLAFLTPPTNQSISNRSPIDYIKEIAATPDGRAALEAQLVPLDPELWKHASFEEFRRRRCEMLVAKAKEFFFADWNEKYVWAYGDGVQPPDGSFWKQGGETT
jgi:integrase